MTLARRNSLPSVSRSPLEPRPTKVWQSSRRLIGVPDNGLLAIDVFEPGTWIIFGHLASGEVYFGQDPNYFGSKITPSSEKAAILSLRAHDLATC